MNNDHDELRGRRSLLAGVGATAAAAALGGTSARAQSSTTAFQPARHAADAWMDRLSGRHRVFIDSATALGGAEALLYANNLYAAQESAYSGEPADFAMIVCLRHLSTPLAFGDEIWASYGATFDTFLQFPDPATGRAPDVNLVNQRGRTDVPNFGITIDDLRGRGTQFAVCDAATTFFARQIAAATGADVGDVHDELVASVLGDARFVSAGVMALTRAQEYGYSLLYAG